jgi:RimJ/RimL family protein N-acetyltransferase
MKFIPMDEAGFRTLLSWFDDPILRRWYGPPTDLWFNYVRNEPGVYAWMVHEHDNPIGHIQVDIKADGVGTIGFLIQADFRNQGVGKQMLKEFLNRPEIARADRIVAETEPDNTASIRCLLSVGFVLSSPQPSEEGFLQYSIDLHQGE